MKSAVELAEDVKQGKASAAELVAAALRRLEADEHNAVLHVARHAMERAERIDEAHARGDSLGPLAGAPVAIKDNICVQGMPTTCGSRILEGWVSPYDATVVRRLEAAGAIVVAKTNMDEFAMGSSSETSAFGAVLNPWSNERTPGGSSGGSAAVVASGGVSLSLGSDTGGSVRQPGALTGLVALKPTYGRVSRYGLVAFASSFDQIGPMSRTAVDSARMLEVIAGEDPHDATSSAHPVGSYEQACSRGVEGLRIGIPRDQLAAAEPSVQARVEVALDALVQCGAAVVDIELPHAEHALSAYYLIAPAEASSNLSRFDGVRYGHRAEAADLTAMYEHTRAAFGREVRRRILLGTYALSAGYYDAYYLRAQKVRTLICRDYASAFERCDVIASPTSPTTAFKLGERVDDPVAMYKSDVFTLPASLAGLPAINVPVGLAESLPAGMQLVGRAFDEETLFAAAGALELSLGPAPLAAVADNDPVSA